MTTRYQSIPFTFSQQTLKKQLIVSDEQRRLPTHIMGGSGSGKTIFAARQVLIGLLRGEPQICIVPQGPFIDFVLHELFHLPEPYVHQILPRIRYTDLGATDYVDPWPLYQNLYDDPLITVVSRHLESIKRSDPHLLSASIEGYNALAEAGMSAGMVVAALGGQIADTVDMLQNPSKWQRRFAHAINMNPESRPGVRFMNKYTELNPSGQRRLSGSYLNKMLSIVATPALRARYCTNRPGLTLQEVCEQGLTWLIAGQSLPRSQKQTYFMPYFLSVLEFANHRGVAGRLRPISLYLEEITALLGFTNEQNEAIAGDIEELVSVLSRNEGVKTTIIHQSLQQISSERIRRALMSMGNQFIGQIHDPDDRLLIARQLFSYDPYLVKRKIPQYVNHPTPEYMPLRGGRETVFSRANYAPVQDIEEYFNIDEQLLALAERFKPENVGKLAFLVRLASTEGAYTNDLMRMHLNGFPYGFPEERQIEPIRRYLRERDGFSVSQLNAEIDRHQKEMISARRTRKNDRMVKSSRESADQ